MANKPGRRKTISVARFPVGGSTMSTFCLSVEVTATGCTRTIAMVRDPYSKVRTGRGRSAPGSWRKP